jgi:N-acetyl-anhydromuramyl-L-alanine amidase AmpD
MQIFIPITNYDQGRGTFKPEAIVLHIMQGSIKSTDGWFGGENNAVGVFSSSHVGISKSGEVHEYVKPYDTAYHAGRVSSPIWSKIKKNFLGVFINPNAYTLGIECEGFRGDKWTEQQMTALCTVVGQFCAKYSIPLTRATIISHNEIATDKEDMRAWCDEVIRRLTPVQPVIATIPDKARAIALMEEALQILKSGV